MKTFREIFAEYGADYDATMGRFMGNEMLYLRILGKLPNDKNMEKLGAAIAAGDLKSAFEAAHTLKGVSGNLGLAPFYEKVCAITEALRGRAAGSGYERLYADVQAEYQRAAQFCEKLKYAVHA